MIWMHINSILELKVGDAIWRLIPGTIFAHYGVVVGFHFGVPIIIENQKGIGARTVSFHKFAQKQRIHIEGRPHGRDWEFLLRAKLVYNQNSKYSLLKWNCEHLKNFIQKGTLESGQLVGGFAIALWFGLYVFSD